MGEIPPWLFSVVHPPQSFLGSRVLVHSLLPLLSFAEEYLGIYVLHFPSHPGEMTGKFFFKKSNSRMCTHSLFPRLPS